MGCRSKRRNLLYASTSGISATKLANFSFGGRRGVGLVDGARLLDLRALGSSLPPGPLRNASTVDEVLASGHLDDLHRASVKFTGSRGIPIAQLRLMSPVLSPEKIFLAAVNYASHGKEQSAKLPKEPYFFTKFRNTLIGDGDPIQIPRNSSKVDWEVELAVIIGRKGAYIPRSKALTYVAGFTVSNDVSFRDLQFPKGWPNRLNTLGQNWVLGKGLDSSFPLGPWLVTPDEVDDLSNLQLTLRVNGDVRQQASTADMVFGVAELISYVSQGITMKPGDIISTGTPMGVAVFTGAPYLKDGDMVEASVTGVGTLRNPVKAEGQR